MAPQDVLRPCTAGCATCARLRRATVDLAGTSGVRSVTERSLAAAAEVPPSVMLMHGGRPVDAWLADAYSAAITALQLEFELGFVPARGWREGTEWACMALGRTLVADPTCARFCFVEAPLGDQTLRDAVDRAHAKWVMLIAREYRLRHPGVTPLGRLDLACHAISHSIAAAVRHGRLDELPGALQAAAFITACG